MMLGKILNFRPFARFNLGYTEADIDMKKVLPLIESYCEGGLGNTFNMYVEINLHELLQRAGAQSTTQTTEIWEDKNFLRGYCKRVKEILSYHHCILSMVEDDYLRENRQCYFAYNIASRLSHIYIRLHAKTDQPNRTAYAR